MVKDVVEYYKQVTQSYNEMRDELRDAEELLLDNSVTPEVVENLKQMVAPIKLNYETLSYFMYLLNKPAKKEKQERYKGQNKKLLKESGSRTAQDISAENEAALKSMRAIKEEIRGD